MYDDDFIDDGTVTDLVANFFAINACNCRVSVIAGLVLLPGGVINAFMSVVAGNMFDRFGPRVMVPVGLFMSLVALFALRTIDGTTSIYFIIAFHIIMFTGISLTMMPAQTNGLNQLPKQVYPDGTAIMNTLQQVASAGRYGSSYHHYVD